MPRSMRWYIEEKRAFDLFKIQMRMEDEIREMIADDEVIIPDYSYCFAERDLFYAIVL